MPLAFRSRTFVFTILAAFVLAQPAAWCSALCLLERHQAAAHAAASEAARTDAEHANAVTRGECHTANTGAVRHDPLQTLSPMMPGATPRMARVPTRYAEPHRAPVINPHDRSGTTETPPPRLV